MRDIFIVVFAKEQTSGRQLMESSRRYLEKLKLKMNTEKFLGFCIGRNGSGIYIRAHRLLLNLRFGKAETTDQRKSADTTSAGE